MDIIFSKLILPTTNKARLFNFITSVFDSDVLIDETGDEYTIVGGINIYFNEVSENISYPKSFFSFKVKDFNDLYDLKSKIEFSYYRDNLGTPSYEVSDKLLEFNDIDGNKWKIELESQILLQKSQIILQDDVRNY